MNEERKDALAGVVGESRDDLLDVMLPIEKGERPLQKITDTAAGKGEGLHITADEHTRAGRNDGNEGRQPDVAHGLKSRTSRRNRCQVAALRGARATTALVADAAYAADLARETGVARVTHRANLADSALEARPARAFDAWLNSVQLDHRVVQLRHCALKFLELNVHLLRGLGGPLGRSALLGSHR